MSNKKTLPSTVKDNVQERRFSGEERRKISSGDSAVESSERRKISSGDSAVESSEHWEISIGEKSIELPEPPLMITQDLLRMEPPPMSTRELSRMRRLPSTISDSFQKIHLSGERRLPSTISDSLQERHLSGETEELHIISTECSEDDTLGISDTIKAGNEGTITTDVVEKNTSSSSEAAGDIPGPPRSLNDDTLGISDTIKAGNEGTIATDVVEKNTSSSSEAAGDIPGPHRSLNASKEWDGCIGLLSENKVDKANKVASQLLGDGILPDQGQLDKLQEMRTTCSSPVVNVCRKLSSELQGRSKKISRIWPAYHYKNRNKIVFVVELNTSKQCKLNIPYSYVIRKANEFSDEGKIVAKEGQTFNELSQEESKKIVQCINSCASRLFQKHRTLSIIQPSPVRSRGYERHEHTIIPEPCVALYIRLKGYIHVEEEPFETHYEGFPVDVREGAFYLQANAKLGCGIKSFRQDGGAPCQEGTLGGFIEHPLYGLCGLTSAHVVLNGSEMEKIVQIKVLSWPLETEISMHLSDSNSSRIGVIVQIVYEQGTASDSGMEIAVFQIESGSPKSDFLNDPANIAKRFVSGRVHGISRLAQNTIVYKLGSGSGMTKGLLINQMPGIAVKTHENHNYHTELRNQLEVRGIGNYFSTKGDSGALVFVEDEDEYVCIGIIAGGTEHGTSVVTPIIPVLQRLGVSSFKSFLTNNLSERIDNLQTEVKRMHSELSLKLDRLLSSQQQDKT